MKVDEQGYGTAGQLEVRHHCRSVNSLNVLDRFQFDDDSAVDEKVQPVSTIHSYPAVQQRHLLLSLDAESTIYQFPVKTRFVTGLQQAGPEFAVNVDRRTDNGPRQDVDVHSGCSGCSVVIEPLDGSAPSVVNDAFEVCLTANSANMFEHAARITSGDL